MLLARAAGQDFPDSPAWRLARASEAEQIAAVNASLDRGMPPDDNIAVLKNVKSSLVLPLMENRVECALKAASPNECFTDKAVDLRRFIDGVALGIAYVGDEEALKQVSKLVNLDPLRFGPLIGRTLYHSKNYSKSHNPFVVAYSGLGTAGPIVDRLVVEWAEKNLSVDPEERARAEEAARGFGPILPPPAENMKHLWAEAMVDHYGGMPTEPQWTADPIGARFPRELSQSLHSEVLRLAQKTAESRRPK
jgi:hypothetical protein